MIQDIFPKRLDNSYHPYSPEATSLVLCFSGDGVLCAIDASGALLFPTYSEISSTSASVPVAVYLFSVDAARYFLCPAPSTVPAGYAYKALRQLRETFPQPNAQMFALYTGFHLWKWYTANRFCGACGTPTVHDEAERMLRCPKCGNLIYPRLNPAVIVAVTNGDRLLVTHYRTGYAHSALIAGFAEIGETLEQTVAREVFEETGLQVRNIRYYKSQPWGVAQDLLTGFFCELDGSDKIQMDASELGSAVWLRREEIVLQPSDYSLTNEMLRLFKDGREQL